MWNNLRWTASSRVGSAPAISGSDIAGADDPDRRIARSAASCRTPAAGAYDRLHARFLRLSGGEAETAQEAALSMLLQPGLRMLDAGCGPATVARRLLALEDRLDLTLLDCDPEMLTQCRDLNAPQVLGSLSNLPFADRSFDVTFAFWSVETLPNPGEGLRELVRVTKPGGWTAVTFCAQCSAIDWIDRCFQIAIGLRNSGRMLDPDTALEYLVTMGLTDIRHLHCRGPARAFIGRKGIQL